jgi:hypothetical protein
VSAEPHALTAAYAADALPGGERVAFERYLEACPARARPGWPMPAPGGG